MLKALNAFQIVAAVYMLHKRNQWRKAARERRAQQVTR